LLVTLFAVLVSVGFNYTVSNSNFSDLLFANFHNIAVFKCRIDFIIPDNHHSSVVNGVNLLTLTPSH
jgi:hypothetical protein